MKNFVFILSAIFVCQNAWSWGDMGHETVAHIAQKNISPKTKAAIESILGVELMAIAATWPDAVRSDSRYKDFAPYHFVEVPQGQTVNTLTNRPAKDALTVLEKFPAIIKDPKATRDQKLIALRYIIHVVGDVHQPLHVGNGLDRGANLCMIQYEDHRSGKILSSNLHSFWDDKLVDQIADYEKGNTKGFFDYISFAPLIMERFKSDPEFAADVSTDPRMWITQSQQLRMSMVYPDTDNAISAQDRLYCAIGSRSVKSEDIPILSKEYIRKVMPIAEKQIMRGGKRLAAYLETVFQNYPETLDDQSVLKSMDIVN